MYPPIFATCLADAGVTALIGSAPCRLYPYGEAPQGVAKPYATWQLVFGAPENYTSGLPDIDSHTVQVDVYAATATAARGAAEAIRDAIEPECHIVAWRIEGRDADTNNYRYSFDSDWWVDRPPQS